MPQELRVGHRSSLVSLVGLSLVLLGLAGLLLAVWRMAPILAAAVALWSTLALVTGHALWRRLEWARRATGWLLASLLPVLVIGIRLAGVNVPMLAMVPLSGALALALSWALRRLNSRGVRQEFA